MGETAPLKFPDMVSVYSPHGATHFGNITSKIGFHAYLGDIYTIFSFASFFTVFLNHLYLTVCEEAAESTNSLLRDALQSKDYYFDMMCI